jgi:peptidoglycan DL-endopeptidase RipA
MDPISRATLPNIIPATPKVGQAGALAPVSPTAAANLAIPLISSTLVDISPLGQFLSGVALSRRQLLALQGATDEASQGAAPVNRDADLVALAQQLTQSFAQLQTSGIDASQLLTGDPQNNLAQRYDLLAGDGSTDTAAALAKDGSLLTQADLAGIGIDLRNEQVDAPILQAAYAADSGATLDALQQGTDVLAQVGAVLAQQQGGLAATTAAVEADLSGEAVPAVPLPAAQLQAQVQAQTDSRILSDEQDLQQVDAIAQRQLEVQQQLETEELTQGLQEAQRQQLQQTSIAQTQSQGQQQDQLQAQRIDSQRLDTQRLDTERQDQQQISARMDEALLDDVRQTQLQQSQLQQQAQVAADEAARAQLADQGLATTAQAEQAQQNAQAQQLAAQNAGQAVPLPSSQDPSVAAAIAAYNLNNVALNPGLMNRSLPASESQKPLVAPVAPVEPVKPVPKI